MAQQFKPYVHKGAPLSLAQQQTLRNLVSKRPAILEKSHTFNVLTEKVKAWAEVTDEFNAAHPYLEEKKTVQQLKRALEYLRSR